VRKRILEKTSSPWAPYLKKRAGSPPTTRFGKAMFMTWPATSIGVATPAARNERGSVYRGRFCSVDLRIF